eukprot:CAMPEP_0117419834 /NCGR_PEP_ID=MMETSP0758-20121206/1311_1 /TAXON_ID=63605 /ORGANISM="Percolomonas cosmopolitus, Strain AE-1 (ATCC 50343)" /LENGTH=538 /DNA_ID=CAMNT_0005201125 /DNA_START=160 /DNA_END=1776 /DNA_ORIENTATION=+
MTPTTGRKMMPCRNPGTGEQLCEPVPAMTKEEVTERVEIARAYQKDVWSKTSYAERRAVIDTILKNVLNNKYEIAASSSKDSGKTMLEAYLGEILASCEKCRWVSKFGEDLLKPESRPVPMLMLAKRAYVEWVPKGVIGMIIPWNYPFHNIIGAVVTALFTGNAVVCKVSEWVNWSLIEEYENIFKDALVECGFSPDLIQFVIGYGETGQALIDADVDHIFFIGAGRTARHVMRAASEHLTECTLELGGKDPFIVCDDVDLNYVVDYATRSIFINCGQNCVASERFYVQENIVNPFVSKVLDLTKTLRQGATCTDFNLNESDVTDAGAMTMTAQLDIIQELVDDAVQNGATVLMGGKAIRTPSGGQFYPPTVITNVKDNMRIVREECFGPVMLIMTFRDDDDVITRANDHEFGLGSYVFCKNTARSNYIADKLLAGVTMVNDYGVFYMIQSLPFGGTKKSGYGKFNGKEGLRAFCYQRSVVKDRIPGFAPAVPAVIRFPTKANAHHIMGAACDLIYRQSWLESGSALIKLLKHMISGK